MKTITMRFEWRGHTIKWQLNQELRADITSDTTPVSDAVDNAIRLMVLHNIRTLTMDGETISFVSRTTNEENHENQVKAR